MRNCDVIYTVRIRPNSSDGVNPDRTPGKFFPEYDLCLHFITEQIKCNGSANYFLHI